MVIECLIYRSFVRHLLLVKCLDLSWVLKTGFEHFTLAVSWIVTTFWRNILPPSSGLEVTQLETACSSAELVFVMPINWHYEGDLSCYKIMIYKFMCLLMTVCFHLGMTGNYIWYCGTPHERVQTEEEFDRIMNVIHYVFVKEWGKVQFSHKVRVWCNIGHSHGQG